MDNVLQALLSWQFVFFALAIAAMTFVIRKVVEFTIDHPGIPTGSMTKEDRFWKELVLPISPVLLGGVVGFLAQMYPFPEGIVSASARVVFGMVAGLLSGLLYRIVKGTLVSKFDVIVPEVPADTKSNSEDPDAPTRNIDNNE
jgi:hypothetical protein